MLNQINQADFSVNSLEKTVDNTLSIVQECEKIEQLYDSSFDDCAKTCHRIIKDLHSGYLKIAVAGTIKSGKSTFINSLVGKDIVKRGAGVVTSITTRIRKGKKNRANIYFKSWDTINLQLKKALELFPYDSLKLDSHKFDFNSDDLNNFDIRRKKNRDLLKKIFKVLTYNFPVTKKGIQPETLLIKHAFQGFEICKDFVKSDKTTLTYEAKKFNKYKDFISDPSIAFYIKDVSLEIYGKIIDPDIEIADCQGADSIDPDQLALILNYLESANLIIYCISSRTGLRQADIEFLNQIKNLGLLDNIIFINNCDFTEHENLSDLIKIEKNIKENLEFLEINPEIFSLSSLYNFFVQLKLKLNKKDTMRLKLWQEENKIVKYCDLQTREFNMFFQGVIDKNRYDFLFSNHFKRLNMIICHIEQRTNIFLQFLSSDNEKEKKAKKDLADFEQNTDRIESMVEKSIEVSLRNLKEKIHIDIHDFFEHDNEAVLSQALDYIKNAAFIDVEQYKKVQAPGFNQILYLIFQDFKRNLDLYVLENVKPKLKKNVKTQEREIISYFQSLFDSLQIDLIKDDWIAQFASVKDSVIQYDALISFEKIKKILGLQMPATVFEAKYTSKIKTSAFTNFGFHTLSGLLSSIFKQNRERVFSFSPGLNKAAIKIKQENLKLIKNQFKQYHTNLETEYFMPLIDAVTRDFKEKINKRFVLYHSYKKEAESVFSLNKSEKQAQKNKIRLIQQQIDQVKKQIAN